MEWSLLEALGLQLQVPKHICTERLSSLRFGQRTVLFIVYYEEPVKIHMDYSAVPVSLACVDG